MLLFPAATTGITPMSSKACTAPFTSELYAAPSDRLATMRLHLRVCDHRV